jgi:DNA-binding transcriptional MerR regulator
VSLVFALTEWKPGEAARLCGVSPDLQRQWRRLGVLTPLTDKKKNRFNIITICYLVAARALIDNGAGHKNIQRLINSLGAQILHVAVLHGDVRARPPVSKLEVESQLKAWALPAVASRMKQRYFAFRNDHAALDSPCRGISFNHFHTLENWLLTGIEVSEFDDEIDVFTGERIEPAILTPEEIAEEEAWVLENPPPPPLPAGVSAVILNVELLAEELLESFGRDYAEVWDKERDFGSASFRDIVARARAVARELESLIDPLLTEYEDLKVNLEEVQTARATVIDERQAIVLQEKEEELEARIEKNFQVRDARQSEIDRLLAEQEKLLEAMKVDRDAAKKEDYRQLPRYRVDSLDLNLGGSTYNSDGDQGNIGSLLERSREHS